MKNTPPVISVLMPVYNAEKFLREAIDSVLNQTFSDFEFVIINDGSTDGSEDIILSYQDDRIRYYKNPKNLRLIATLNKGLDLVTGQFIARMDADDICLPERFEKQIEIMRQQEEIAVCGSWYEKFGGDKPITILGWKEPYKLKCQTLFGSPVGHPASMIRRAALKASGLKYDKNYPHAEDWKLWSEMVKKGLDLYNIQEVLLLYRVNPTSVSTLNKIEQNAGSFKILTENFAHFFPSINMAEHSSELKSIFKPFAVKNDLTSFRALDIFLARLEEQNITQFEQRVFRKKLIGIWKNRLLEMPVNVFSKIWIIVNSTFFGRHQNSFLVKMKLVRFLFFGK